MKTTAKQLRKQLQKTQIAPKNCQFITKPKIITGYKESNGDRPAECKRLCQLIKLVIRQAFQMTVIVSFKGYEIW